MQPGSLELAGIQDYFTVEYPFSDYGYPPADRSLPDYTLARSLGDRPAFTLLSVGTVADLAPRGPMTNLMRIFIAAMLFHLINGDYTVSTDTIRDSAPFALDADLPAPLRGDPTLQAYCISPDRKAALLVETTLRAGGIWEDLPGLRVRGWRDPGSLGCRRLSTR